MRKRRKMTFGKRLLAAVLCIIMIFLTACATPADGNDTSGSTEGKRGTAQESGKNQTKVRARDLTDGVVANAVSAQEANPDATVAATDFGLQIFRNSMQAGENTLVSPASVLFAMGMTMNGARGNTLAQFEDVLGMSVEELNLYLYAYRNSLPNGTDCRVTSANSIWINEDAKMEVLQDFLQRNADYYASDVYETPFNDSARDDINIWVAEHTDDMIPEILDQIPENTVMYLVNAMAFDAKWAKPYKEDQLKDGKFKREDGEAEDACFMHSEESAFLKDEHAVGFLKYYKGKKYAFAALLPEEGMALEDYIASLDGEKLNRMLNDPEEVQVRAFLPIFEAEYSTELSRVLSGMGMPDAFSEENADFSGLAVSEEENVYINRVLHKTYISVDADGTKAGAATAVEMRSKSAVEIADIEVRLDRPFVYFLIDCEEGLPIFMGTVYTME